MNRINFLILITIILSSCSPFGLREPVKSDYFSEGPLNSHVFQVVIRETPDKKRKNDSIVREREQVYLKVKSNLKERFTERLYSYVAAQNKKLTKDKKFYLNYLEQYYKDTKTVQEYYLNDNTLVLVLRTYNLNIKKDLLSLK